MKQVFVMCHGRPNDAPNQGFWKLQAHLSPQGRAQVAALQTIIAEHPVTLAASSTAYYAAESAVELLRDSIMIELVPDLGPMEEDG